MTGGKASEVAEESAVWYQWLDRAVARECVVVDCVAAGSDLYSSSYCRSGCVRLPRRYVWCDATQLFHILQYPTTYSKHTATAFLCVAACGATWLIHCVHCNRLQHSQTKCNSMRLLHRDVSCVMCGATWLIHRTHCNILQHSQTLCNSVHLLRCHVWCDMTQWLQALQHTATYCNTLQHTATYCNTLQHTATYCNILQHTQTLCNILKHSAPASVFRVAPSRHLWCNPTTSFHTLQRTAMHSNILQQPLSSTSPPCLIHFTHCQHTATRCTTLQHLSLSRVHSHCNSCNTLHHPAPSRQSFASPRVVRHDGFISVMSDTWHVCTTHTWCIHHCDARHISCHQCDVTHLTCMHDIHIMYSSLWFATQLMSSVRYQTLDMYIHVCMPYTSYVHHYHARHHWFISAISDTCIHDTIWLVLASFVIRRTCAATVWFDVTLLSMWYGCVRAKPHSNTLVVAVHIKGACTVCTHTMHSVHTRPTPKMRALCITCLLRTCVVSHTHILIGVRM